MRTLTIAALVAFTALAGCSKDKPNPYAHEGADGQPVYVPTRVAQEFYNSWGHTGRGGAALRKPAYQHVMGTEEVLMTTNGNYADLRSGIGEPSVVNQVMNNGGNAVGVALAATPAPITTDGMTTSVSRGPINATDDEYLRAYRKFCQGAGMTMTEREWEIVALGGPSRIPPALRGKCMHSK